MSRLCVNFWSPATLLRSLTVCRLPAHRQLATLAFLRLVDAVTNFWSIGRGHFGRWDFCSVFTSVCLFATLTHYKSVTTSVSWIFVASCQDKRVCNSKPLSRPLLWSKGVSQFLAQCQQFWHLRSVCSLILKSLISSVYLVVGLFDHFSSVGQL